MDETNLDLQPRQVRDQYLRATDLIADFHVINRAIDTLRLNGVIPAGGDVRYSEEFWHQHPELLT